MDVDTSFNSIMFAKHILFLLFHFLSYFSEGSLKPFPIFSSSRQFASSVLGLALSSSTTFVFWEEKTVTIVPTPASQPTMAFRLIDLMSFMPLGPERRMVEGHPIMRLVMVMWRSRTMTWQLLFVIPCH